jgi:hypothetical protein
VTSLTLNRLGEHETAAIITRLVENKELPADVLAKIVERDGIPLFAEGDDEGGAGGRERGRGQADCRHGAFCQLQNVAESMHRTPLKFPIRTSYHTAQFLLTSVKSEVPLPAEYPARATRRIGVFLHAPRD